VGRVKTVVTNHYVRCFEVIHKAAERNIAARINSDKLTETNSQCFHKHLLLGLATIC